MAPNDIKRLVDSQIYKPTAILPDALTSRLYGQVVLVQRVVRSRFAYTVPLKPERD